jgi:hypothetical protein
MNHIKNNKKSKDFRNLKKKNHEQKVSRLLPYDCNFQKEKNILWYGLKFYRKSKAQPMDFYSL